MPPAKRSNFARSSSFGDCSVSNKVTMFATLEDLRKKNTSKVTTVTKPVQNSVKNLKPFFTKPVLSGPVTFTIGSPVREMNNEMSDKKTDERFGVFLEACYYCKDKIDEKDDVFMYGYLHAFCSPECRDKQIVVDNKLKKDSEDSMDIETLDIWKKKLKDRFGAQNGK